MVGNALDVHVGEDESCCVPGDKLESTLGIGDFSDAEDVENCVEGMHQEIPQGRSLVD